MLSIYSKMHIFNPADDRMFVLLAAGNLSTTQMIVRKIEQDMADTKQLSLKNCRKLSDAVQYISLLSKTESERAQSSTASAGIDTSVSFIFGGQIKGEPPAIYLVYSAGNFISDSDQMPFLQIGESKFGKPILDRILSREISLEDAARCAIVSMDSTIKSNATVGPPIEVLVYENDTFTKGHYIKMDEDDNYLREIKLSWNEALKQAFSRLPPFHWENNGSVNMQIVTDQFQKPGTS